MPILQIEIKRFGTDITADQSRYFNIMATKDIGLESKTETRFSYCNTNYAMLALIIEKITKLTYKEAMREMIFKPLGMKNTYVFDYERDKNKLLLRIKEMV